MPHIDQPRSDHSTAAHPTAARAVRMRRLATIASVATIAALALTSCAGTAAAPAPSKSSSPTATSTVAPVKGGAAQVAIALKSTGSADTCTLDHTTAKAGPITFTVANESSTAITEVELQSQQRILGEKENLAPGLAPVSFTVTLGGGVYQVYCPGAAKDLLSFTVTGKAAATGNSSTQTLLTQGTKGYGEYVSGVVADMVTAVGTLKTAVDSGDVATAKVKYALARPFYERIESDVEGFVLPGHSATDNAANLDYLIDMRASNLDPSVGWHGFHAIERDLWQRGKITASTKTLAAELQRNVAQLSTLSKTLTYKPEDLANGAASLLEEVQSGKIKGEEEQFSHLDLVDFAANVEGAQQAFAFLAPGVKKIDPTLAADIDEEFTTVNAALAKFQDDEQAGGYEIYTAALRNKDAASLSATVQGLQAPLSKVAAKVATAG